MKKWLNFTNLPKLSKRMDLAVLYWLILGISLFSVIYAFIINWGLGLIWLGVVLIALRYGINTTQAASQDTEEYLNDLTYRVSRTEQEALIEMPIGIILLDKSGHIDWVNPYVQSYLGQQDIIGLLLKDVDAGLSLAVKNYTADNQAHQIDWLNRVFKVAVQENLHVVYLMDVTPSVEIQQQFQNHRLIGGLISVDNYEEVTDGLSDSESSKLRTYVTSELSDWAVTHGLYLRRLSPVSYLLFGYQTGLRAAEDDKFGVVKSIREATAQQNSPLTLSMGIAYGQEDINKLIKLAQTNLDLALGRGGDQVVVKSEDAPARFYGGTTNPMEKRTRVRARVVSQTIAELMDQADQVMIVGHNMPDLDSIGAALGLWRFAQTRNKPAYVVVDEGNIYSDIQLLLTELRKSSADDDRPGYAIGSSIIDEESAVPQATERTLLILVDHAKADLTGAPELLEKLGSHLVVIDHHRLAERGLNQKPLLSYIEPYASSTSELVAELLQYQNQSDAPITKIEATAMLGGIQIDTKNFTLRTGSRTFDAASYLRANGADSNLIQAFMKEKFSDFQARTHLINMTKIEDQAAIVVGENDQIYPGVITAQAADELLQISGVDASFVITKRRDGRVGISARSTGNYNVQTVMEAMGGGGHLSNAATQIKGINTDDAYRQLMDAIASQAEKAE
ncbi:DHH family phosphoesterase [Convivina intestini]|uniref:DHH family phosphoesterase n=1 Tax=Convivina intestini TaxID=1505726 RepID=UPI00200CC7C2|nr:DHH family phosphoesterase [Convivina intestini]CAH1855179.1 Cyclic-di-AMP phosphodiesterase GdpP [Convivina intestini]